MSTLHDAVLGLLDPIVAGPEDRTRYGHHAQAARYRARAAHLTGKA